MRPIIQATSDNTTTTDSTDRERARIDDAPGDEPDSHAGENQQPENENGGVVEDPSDSLEGNQQTEAGANGQCDAEANPTKLLQRRCGKPIQFPLRPKSPEESTDSPEDTASE